MKQIFAFLLLMTFAFSMNAQYIYNDFDANQNEAFVGWPNNPTIVSNPSSTGINTSANSAEWIRSGEQWAHTYCLLPGKVDFTTGNIFSIKVYSPIACDVLFKLEDQANGAINTERLLSISSTNTWVQLDFDFTGEGSDLYDKIVIFFDFANPVDNTFYFDDIEGPNYAVQGKPLEATDVQDNFENNGWGTIANWIFQDPGMDPLTTIADPVTASNTVANYNRSGGFEWTNAQAELDHRMDLTNRNVFEMDVYFPSSNDYTGSLTNTVDIKLQNSLLGGNAWTTQAVVSHTVSDYDQWVTLSFDFSGWATTEDYDKIVVQFGGEGHWVPGQFYFDNIELLPWYPTPAFTYNDFDANQNVDFSGYPNMPVIVSNPDATGINTSANAAEWIRSTDQWAHMFTILEGPVNFDNGTNFQIKVHSPISCNVLFKLENKDNAGVFIEQTATVWNANEWELLNFDFPGAASETYDKIIIFLDFASTNDNIFYVDDIVGPEYDEPKPILELDVQDYLENDGWSTIDYWIFQDPGMDTLIPTTDPVDPTNTVGDYNRSGTFEWANAQTIIDHRLDLSERNKFELMVYFPSSNDYIGALTPTAAIKLQNSLLGGNAWTTQAEVVQTVTVFDEWVTLVFDFEAWNATIDYDQIVIQFGGEGHFVPGQFYFDDLYLKHVPFVAVLSPNGGEMIDQGSSFDIEWNYDWWEGDIKIELMNGDQDPELITYNIPASDTIFNWVVMPGQEPGSEYRIIITSLDDSFPSDTSDGHFTIVEVNVVLSNFNATVVDMAEGDSTLFTDMSTGNPTSWEWEFEGGTPATYSGQNPPYIVYENAGMYDVTLTVSDGTVTDILTQIDYITVGAVPVADFTASETTILVGTTVDFTNNSVGENVTYEWYFEGGTPSTSNDESPSGILYAEMGLFDVQLIATNGYGIDTLIMEDYIEAKPVGVQTSNEEFINVWPNPATEILNIELASNSIHICKILDLQGTVVESLELTSQYTVIDLSNVKSGLYLISIVNLSTNKLTIKKILIK